MNRPRFFLLAGNIPPAAASCLIPHPPNFSLITALLAAARKIEMGCILIQNVTLPRRCRRAAALLQRRRMTLAGAASGVDNQLK
jgi:hypothetical protein